MKKVTIWLLVTVLTLAMLGLAMPASGAETQAEAGTETGTEAGTEAGTETAPGAPYGLVTIVDGNVRNGTIAAGNNVKTIGSGDVIKFGFKGDFDPMIHINLNEPADTAEYPILAIKAQQTGSAQLNCEVFYNEPGAGAEGGKSVISQWADTAEWQWLKFDLSDRGNVGYLRFDVFFNGDVKVTGMIAAVAFFKTVEDADAFAAGEQGLKLGTDPGEESIIREIEQEKAANFYLYDEESSISTGWWFHPYAEGKSISVAFDSPVWFSKVWFFAYASQHECPILFTVMDENDDEVFSQELGIIGNDENVVDLGLALPPGYYTIMFESVEVDEELAGNIHFVLGSAAEGDVEVEFMTIGGNTNNNTQPAPAIRLIICDADPNYTEKPVVTPKVTELPTPVPTSVPLPDETEAPSATGAGTPTKAGGDNNDNNGDKDNKNKGKVGLIVGIAAGAVVAAAAVTVAVIAAKKKEK